MLNLTPAGNLIAGAVAAAVTGVGGHYAVSYGIPITPDMALTIPTAVGFIVAHAYDVMTGQNVPAPAQGQMTPPPIQPQK